MDTLETVFEHLKYVGDPKEEFAMTLAYDHRKAELTIGNGLIAYLHMYGNL
jgi:hemolysin expression modulating protein